MSWIPAPEAHVEAGDQIALGVCAVDVFGLAAAQAGRVSTADGAVLAANFEHIDGANGCGLLHQHLDMIGAHALGPDAVRPSAALNVLSGDAGVLGRCAPGEQGDENQKDAAHVIGSDDGWITAYIGIPFLEKGRTRAGLDCWGLIRLVWLERLGVALPLWCEGYAATDPCDETAGHLAGCARAFAEVPAGHERPGDILLFRTGRILSHVGLCIGGGRMLHILDGIDSCIQSYRSPMWARRLVEVRRV